MEWAPESAAQYDVSSLERPAQSESAVAAAKSEEERRQSSFTLQQCLEVRPLQFNARVPTMAVHLLLNSCLLHACQLNWLFCQTLLQDSPSPFLLSIESAVRELVVVP